MERDAEFQKHLLQTFRLEAEEHLQGITGALIELEKGVPEDRAQLVETVFREAHSLKGAARSVGLAQVESLCQGMEGLFSGMKRGEVTPTAEILDLLQQAVDLLGRFLSAEGGESPEEDRASQRELVKKLVAARGGAAGPAAQGPAASAAQVAAATSPPVAAPAPGAGQQPAATAAPEGQPSAPAIEPRAGQQAAAPHPPQAPVEPKAPAREHRAAASGSAETVRVAWSKLSAVLLLSEEMLSAKLSSRQRALRMREIRSAFAAWGKEWGKVAPQVQRLMGASARGAATDLRPEPGGEPGRILEFLSWNSAFIKSLEGRCRSEAKEAEQESRALGGMVDNLLAEMKKAMMFPFSSLLEAFPKIVRELSRDNGKEAELVVQGEEIEIDRRILEEMKDPLIHLVRNCIDHGIEKPELREARNKPRRGKITINIAPRDDKAEIVVGDDGAGISPADLRAAVVKLGLMPFDKAQALADAEVLNFVFQSGLSTSPIITDVSGHGLGLAIVKEKVEKLGGTVSLESAPEEGTTFRIVLPLSVATFRGILVRVGDRPFVLPATHVDRAIRLRSGETKTVENRETVTLGGSVLSLERLWSVLELPEPPRGAGDQQAVVVSAGELSIAFVVDEVLGEQEVLLKSLGPQLARVRNVAGATVLGSGKVAPILNVADLVKSASREGGRAPLAQPEASAAGAVKVLVVEDSITSRTLLKSILESGGYSVTTAVDGVDALAKLKEGGFDVVISDVEMPRMDGFELTTRIRQDQELGELPVVLVTALGTKEDRERGVDVGANAYIVKSSFDQSNLLEVVKRLV